MTVVLICEVLAVLIALAIVGVLVWHWGWSRGFREGSK